MIDEQIINLVMVVGVIGFIVYFKYIKQRNEKKPGNSDFSKAYFDILNSDQYKVKGKYE